MSLKRVAEYVAYFAEKENAEEGFSAKDLYRVGIDQFGLTCSDVYNHFVGKDRAIARGRYLPKLTEELIELSKKEPEKAVKEPKAPREPKERKQREPKERKNGSTLEVTTRVKMDPEAAAARKKLIASIAERNNKEDREIARLVRGGKFMDMNPSDKDAVKEEFERITRQMGTVENEIMEELAGAI